MNYNSLNYRKFTHFEKTTLFKKLLSVVFNQDSGGYLG